MMESVHTCSFSVPVLHGEEHAVRLLLKSSYRISGAHWAEAIVPGQRQGEEQKVFSKNTVESSHDLEFLTLPQDDDGATSKRLQLGHQTTINQKPQRVESPRHLKRRMCAGPHR